MRVLITGKDSYIGTSVQKWLAVYSPDWQVDTIDMTDDNWRNLSFAGYHIIFHVAGIVHKKEKRDMAELINKINHNLPVEVAKKSKNENVQQFIFMSSMNVYGIQTGSIDFSTFENPVTMYGKSKLDAENELLKIADEGFSVAIIRAPMVYGYLSPGNYAKMERMIRILPFFPDYKNNKSLLHIDNLCELVRLIADKKKNGYFFPQDERYLSSLDLAKEISNINKKDLKLIKFLNPIIDFFLPKSAYLQKLFGDLTYERKMSEYDDIEYWVHKRNWEL